MVRKRSMYLWGILFLASRGRTKGSQRGDTRRRRNERSGKEGWTTDRPTSLMLISSSTSRFVFLLLCIVKAESSYKSYESMIILFLGSILLHRYRYGIYGICRWTVFSNLTLTEGTKSANCYGEKKVLTPCLLSRSLFISRGCRDFYLHRPFLSFRQPNESTPFGQLRLPPSTMYIKTTSTRNHFTN